MLPDLPLLDDGKFESFAVLVEEEACCLQVPSALVMMSQETVVTIYNQLTPNESTKMM